MKTMCEGRIDLNEYNILEGKLNIEQISYAKVIALFRNFVKLIISSDDALDSEVKDIVLDSINGVCDSSTDNEIRINKLHREKIWSLHDSFQNNGHNKKFARLSVCCFYDVSFSRNDPNHYNSEEVISLFYELLCELDSDLCKEFTSYALRVIVR